MCCFAISYDIKLPAIKFGDRIYQMIEKRTKVTWALSDRGKKNEWFHILRKRENRYWVKMLAKCN